MLSEENRVSLLTVLSLSMVELKPSLHERLARSRSVVEKIYCPGPLALPTFKEAEVRYPLSGEVIKNKIEVETITRFFE
jgi:hypothetical protein